jgi:uncharacterized peroxidase-related enzyme
MYLEKPFETEATQRLFQSDLDELGYVMNYKRLWALRPEICEDFARLRAQLMEGSTLSKRDLAVCVCASVANFGDSYCSLAWGRTLADRADAATAAAALDVERRDGLSQRDRALVDWARKVVRTPGGTTPADVDRLRQAGFSEKEIFEATVLMAFRVAFSMVNNALGVNPDRQVAEAAPPEVREVVTYGRAPAPYPS